MKKKNVLLWSIDALRSDCTGLNPDFSKMRALGVKDRPDTKNLDRFLTQCTLFNNGFTAAPYTSASHASIFTGMWPVNHGLREHYRTPVRHEIPLIFQMLKKHGYTTIMVTDFPAIFCDNLGLTRGVDYYIAFDHKKLRQLLADLSDVPILLFWHFADIHSPYGLNSLEIDGEDHFVREVENISRLSGRDYDDSGEELWNVTLASNSNELRLRKHYFQCQIDLYRSGRFADLMNLYSHSVTGLDAGRFSDAVDLLDDAGWIGNAHICLFGDHGEEYSKKCFMHHTHVTEGAINVPIAFLSPDLPIGQVDSEVVRTIDIVPTILDLCDLPVPEETDGVSLVNRMTNHEPLDLLAMGELFDYEADTAEEATVLRNLSRDSFNEASTTDVDLANLQWPNSTIHRLYARDRRWKLVIDRNPQDGKSTIYLFDLKASRSEEVDVSERYPRAVKTLLSELQFMIQPELDKSVPVSPDEIKNIASQLEDMGYLRGQTK